MCCANWRAFEWLWQNWFLVSRRACVYVRSRVVWVEHIRKYFVVVVVSIRRIYLFHMRHQRRNDKLFDSTILNRLSCWRWCRRTYIEHGRMGGWETKLTFSPSKHVYTVRSSAANFQSKIHLFLSRCFRLNSPVHSIHLLVAAYAWWWCVAITIAINEQRRYETGTRVKSTQIFVFCTSMPATAQPYIPFSESMSETEPDADATADDERK